jgi:hypothetical protein
VKTLQKKNQMLCKFYRLTRMETPSDPTITPSYPACKRLVAVLANTPDWDPEVCSALEREFGKLDYRGALIPFEGDTYYGPEMGSSLWRGWLGFRGIVDPAALPQWKHAARRLEGTFSREGKRVFNLDIGYMDADKVVLASFKRGPCKLYLGEDVWADMILGYSRGAFTPTPWAFADFRDGRYDKSLGVIREKLKAEMRR